jgi:hypothetical protein
LPLLTSLWSVPSARIVKIWSAVYGGRVLWKMMRVSSQDQ